ncbi:uncharacterized protein LOC129182026 isoform X2 [Dunckerocampus dactyliophorus]|uniref:uncharacterized protein LOC129182026 isoform X2 n=1 Tax=Dunckerocampus dactyliophorus TaxID=161453 RepID=UPI0024057050|nr:uncharacterized protein LOC129182026 isoform X2 [Dunckerocampus dactyliophorus]
MPPATSPRSHLPFDAPAQPEYPLKEKAPQIMMAPPPLCCAENISVLLPVRMDKSDFVSVFDLRRKHFVCMDSKGQLYNSRQKEREDCLFHRTGFISGVFYSPPSGSQLPLSPLESSHPSFVFLKRFLAPLVTRQRRSEEVNPADPLRSESDPSHSVQDHKDFDHLQPEQDQAGAVSKETISSCDDPLKVLHANGPVSPVKTIIADRAEQD